MIRYSRLAILLHWSIAFLLMFQISLGWGMGGMGAQGFAAFQLHKSIGILILLLTLTRIAVRFWKPRPAPMEGGVTGALAKAVHLGLYAFMLGGPLTGWALVSTSARQVPTLLFGTIPLPHLPLPHATNALFENAHGLLVWIGLALFLLHVAGAVRHHILMRDGLIFRMVPVRSSALMWALIALIPAGLFASKGITGFGSLPKPAPAAIEAGNAADPALNVMEAANVAEAVTENAAATVTNAAAVTEREEEPAGPPPAWTVQPGGKIGFSVGNGTDSLSGSFSRWTATIAMDPDHPETAEIAVDIDLASGSMADPTQNEMLPNDEFLGVAAHPHATFKAKGATKTGPDSYTAKGILSLKGATAPQSIRFTLKGAGATRTVSGTATIARKTFDVGNGEMSGTLAPTVAVNFTFSAKQR